MTTIYLTRHGQTVWNVEGRMQGWKDSPLTDLGIQQSLWLREKILGLDIDVIYSSISGRAIQTATIVKGDTDITIVEEPNLREIKLGDFQGLTQEEIKLQYNNQYNNYYNNPNLYMPIGDGENFKELIDRSYKALLDIIRNNKDKRVLVITHTMVIKSILCKLNNLEIDRFWDKPYIRQGSITIIEEVNGILEVKKSADISHHRYVVKEFNE